MHIPVIVSIFLHLYNLVSVRLIQFIFILFLVERNILFWQHLNSIIQNTILTNSKQLIEADQLLIKSLVTLQTASKTIKQIDDNTTQLLQKSQNILTGNFLPTIKFKD